MLVHFLATQATLCGCNESCQCYREPEKKIILVKPPRPSYICYCMKLGVNLNKTPMVHGLAANKITKHYTLVLYA